MGQKVNPISMRLGINRTWDSRWVAGKGDYGKLLHEDIAIRAALMKQLKQAAVSAQAVWRGQLVLGGQPLVVLQVARRLLQPLPLPLPPGLPLPLPVTPSGIAAS